MNGYDPYVSGAKVGDILIRRKTNLREAQAVEVVYASKEFIITRGMGDNREEVFPVEFFSNRGIKAIYYTKPTLEND